MIRAGIRARRSRMSGENSIAPCFAPAVSGKKLPVCRWMTIEPRGEERNEHEEERESPRRSLREEERGRGERNEEQGFGTRKRGEEERDAEKRRAPRRPRRGTRERHDDERHENGERRLHAYRAPPHEPRLRGEHERGGEGRPRSSAGGGRDPVDENDRSRGKEPGKDPAPDEKIGARPREEREDPHPERARRAVCRIPPVEGELSRRGEIPRVLEVNEGVVDDRVAERQEEHGEQNRSQCYVPDVFPLHFSPISFPRSSLSLSASALREYRGTPSREYALSSEPSR